MSSQGLYESTYQSDKHFSFGQNWQDYLQSLTPERITIAKASLTDFLGGKDAVKGKTFVDIGCGSGLFSLSAFLLGAKRVVSVDIDDNSLACVTSLREKHKNPDNWDIKKGSALDADFIKSLGTFDIVYSWGVLHHTGDMYTALDNVTALTKPKSQLYIALYNDNRLNVFHGTSSFWLRVKQLYNKSGIWVKKVLYCIYATYLYVGLAAAGRNPGRYIANYQSARGMSWKHDVIDWLGGYPYECASVDQIVNFFGERGYGCRKINPSTSIGCNEFLLVKVPS